MTEISNNYCSNRAFELKFGIINFPEEHDMCGKKKCWKRVNVNLFEGKKQVKVSLNFNVPIFKCVL